MARIPRYQVIYEDLSAQIASGVLLPDTRLPSEIVLAERYGVSRMTVRQAVRQLEGEGLLARRRGAGTFVTQPRAQHRRLNRLESFADEIGVDAGRVRSIVRHRSTVRPSADVADRLGVAGRQDVVRIERLRLVDEVPAALQESWLPYALVPLLAREELVDGSLYRTLRQRCGLRLARADQEVSASAATVHQASALDVDEGSPLIVSARLTHDDTSVPVEFARSWARPEFSIVIRLEI